LNARVHEEIRRREPLERYHSPAVVNRILETSTHADAFLAQERDVSVLFADLVGFTTLSEHLSPAQTATLLNGFFDGMTEIVFQNDGTLDKFIGDALMAVFGAPIEQSDHAMRAARTAQQMQQALRDYNAQTTGPRLSMRIGIHSGIVRAGDIGSNRRREYTILGDVVNTASRLESDVAHPGRVALSRATLAGLDDSFLVHPLGSISLRGRREPVDVFELAVPD
jgi:adenylate cyclase